MAPGTGKSFLAATIDQCWLHQHIILVAFDRHCASVYLADLTPVSAPARIRNGKGGARCLLYRYLCN